MKKYIIAVATLTLLGGSVAVADNTDAILKEVSKLDVKKVCDVKANGLEKVLAVAKKYNPTAIKLQIEFKRLGIRNKEYIRGVEEAIKNKKPEVTLHYKKKGKVKTKKFKTEYADWRACTFAVRALQQHVEAEKTWRLAVPGDGFKF